MRRAENSDPSNTFLGLLDHTELNLFDGHKSNSLIVMFPQRIGPSKSSKPSCSQKAKPVQDVVPVLQIQAAADPLPAVSEESVDVSMKEEEPLCQAFSEMLLTVQDVDEKDADLPQLCSEYVKDIYNYLHVLEVILPPSLSRCAASTCCVTSVRLLRCSRPCEPTTCRAMKSLSACGRFSSTGWSRFTPGSSCCRRLCSSQSPPWTVSSR